MYDITCSLLQNVELTDFNGANHAMNNIDLICRKSQYFSYLTIVFC